MSFVENSARVSGERDVDPDLNEDLRKAQNVCIDVVADLGGGVLPEGPALHDGQLARRPAS